MLGPCGAPTPPCPAAVRAVRLLSLLYGQSCYDGCMMEAADAVLMTMQQMYICVVVHAITRHLPALSCLVPCPDVLLLLMLMMACLLH